MWLDFSKVFGGKKGEEGEKRKKKKKKKLKKRRRCEERQRVSFTNFFINNIDS